jgi:hypothetical protein
MITRHFYSVMKVDVLTFFNLEKNSDGVISFGSKEFMMIAAFMAALAS